MLTGRYIELPAVPGAGEHLAAETARAERPTLMRAEAIDGMEPPRDVGQRHDSVTSHAFDAHTRRAFRCPGDRDPVGNGKAAQVGRRDTATILTRPISTL